MRPIDGEVPVTDPCVDGAGLLENGAWYAGLDDEREVCMTAAHDAPS